MRIFTVIFRYILISLLLCIININYAFAGPQSISNTTASTIIDRARDYLGAITESGVTDPFYHNDKMLRFLNLGTRDIALKSDCFQASESISLISGQEDGYIFSAVTDYVRLFAVKYINEDSESKGLRLGSIFDAGKMSETHLTSANQEPVLYYDFGGKIGIYPALVSISGTTPETLTAFYSYSPGAIALTDSVLVPTIYEQALVLFIAAEAALSDGMSDRYAIIKQEYSALITFLANYNRLGSAAP